MSVEQKVGSTQYKVTCNFENQSTPPPPPPSSAQGCIWTGEYSQPKNDVQVGSEPACQVEPEATVALIYSATDLIQTDGSPLTFSFIPHFNPPLLSLSGNNTSSPHTHTYTSLYLFNVSFIQSFSGRLSNEYRHCFLVFFSFFLL